MDTIFRTAASLSVIGTYATVANQQISDWLSIMFAFVGLYVILLIWTDKRP